MIVHKNPYFSVKRKKDYYSITFSTEQVIILPVVDNSHIFFIQTIRPVFDKPFIELPAGTSESEENIEMAALRELSEETGISKIDERRFKPLPSLNVISCRTAPFWDTFKVNISREEYENRPPHDYEVAGTLLLLKNQVINKIHNGEIYVATVVAVCLQHILINYT